MSATSTGSELRVLVAGATGRLGRPVADLLLERGHCVRALTRDPSSKAGKQLESRGAEIVPGDFDDRDSLVAAARGVDAVFAAGTAHRAGPEGEARHGKNIADAVAAAGAGELVYVSGAPAERVTGVPVFDSKHAVEQHIHKLAIPHTILAPVYFMENAFNPWNLAALAAGRFALPLPAERALFQVAIADVAAVAAHVLERPGAFTGERIQLASEALTGQQAADALGRVTGRPWKFERLPLDQVPAPLRTLFTWLDQIGDSVEIAALRRRFPRVAWHSFEGWAATREWPRRNSGRPMETG